ncbi:hypothetical protein C0J52_20990 [Blattella germanica]|nr:hypothetical protein C0J52_20990 [Blattella germanica]
MGVVSIAVLFLVMVALSHQHGMVMDPINRSSMWKKGYPVPPNYDDDGNYCGEVMQDWEHNNFKCGLCGDPYSEKIPRPNENTGHYGKGIIVATYKSGSSIKATVELTANHWGRFYFHICPLASKTALETEECFQAHPVYLTSGEKFYKLTSHNTGDFEVDLQLPQGLTCEHSNSWGNCADGSEGMGCGPQETFRTCSDITIN